MAHRTEGWCVPHVAVSKVGRAPVRRVYIHVSFPTTTRIEKTVAWSENGVKSGSLVLKLLIFSRGALPRTPLRKP